MDDADTMEMVAGDFDDFASDVDAAETEGLEGLRSDSEDDDDELVEGVEDDEDDLEMTNEERDALLEESRVKRDLASKAAVGTIRVLARWEYMTSDILELYEISQILATRSEQISKYDNVFLPRGVARASTDPVRLAIQELTANMCPLVISRVRSHGGQLVVEKHKVRDLLIPPAIEGISS